MDFQAEAFRNYLKIDFVWLLELSMIAIEILLKTAQSWHFAFHLPRGNASSTHKTHRLTYSFLFIQNSNNWLRKYSQTFQKSFPDLLGTTFKWAKKEADKQAAEIENSVQLI